MFNYDEFKAEVVAQIREFLPAEYEEADVSISKVVKNQENLDGLMIRIANSNICPTIYLNGLYEKYKNEEDFVSICEQIARIRIEHEVDSFDVSNITDFAKVKANIIPRLVGTANNKDYVESRPHILMDDLAIVFAVFLENTPEGTVSVVVTDELLKSWNVDVQCLYELAVNNMNILTPPTFRSLRDIIIEMQIKGLLDMVGDEETARAMLDDVVPDELPMYVLSNKSGVNGAAALLSSATMENVRDEIGEDFYILPSSIHECICVRGKDLDLAELADMVCTVNSSEVAPQDKLSDGVYKYDYTSQKIVKMA